VVPTRPIFDWRQLRRWGIRESSLPSGSEIRFKEPGFFEQYRWRAIAVISLCAVQSLLIALLLVERRRRRRMQIALRERLEFETLFAELSADFTRRPASEIDQGIAKWLQRLGEFFGTGPGDLFELVENGKSAGTSGATGFASGEPYQFTDQFCSGALFSPAANPPGGNLNETEGAPKEAWRKPVLAIPICANGSTWTLTFSATPVQNGWPEDLLPRLRLAGEIFAGAIVRKTSEEALQESQDRYRLATSAGRVVVWDWNIQTSELYADPLLKSLLGYEDHELGNHFDDWFRLIHPEDVEFVLERLRAHVHGGASHFEAEHRFLRKDGSVRWFLASGTAVRNEQGIAVRMVGTDTDITERKLIELELQHLSGRLLDLQDQERQRISRKLHDGTAQSLFAISLNLEYLKKAHGVLPKRFQHALSECRTLCEQCLQEIRTLSYVLHPPMLDGAGLIAALGWYLDGFAKRSGIHVELIAPQDHWRLPEEIEMDLFRIVQECLANVHRHSGSSTAQVRIERAASGVVLRVEDQGRGMQSKTSLLEAEDSLSFGVGLSGIRQRLRHLGGRLEIVSNEQGTTVTAIVPLALAETASDSSPDIGDLEMQGVRREGRRISMRQTEAKSSFNLLSELR
jgi:PAS domain S-box-containing protein